MMTRKECEEAIEQKLREIVEIYHQYNPQGNYLSMGYINDENGWSIMYNNSSWNANEKHDIEAGADYVLGKIIDGFIHEDYNAEEDN